jgi:hypothetical protein
MAGAALWMNNTGKIAASTNSAPLAPSIIAKSYTNSYSISETSPPSMVVKSYSNPSSMDSCFTNIFYIQDKQQLCKGNHQSPNRGPWQHINSTDPANSPQAIKYMPSSTRNHTAGTELELTNVEGSVFTHFHPKPSPTFTQWASIREHLYEINQSNESESEGESEDNSIGFSSDLDSSPDSRCSSPENEESELEADQDFFRPYHVRTADNASVFINGSEVPITQEESAKAHAENLETNTPTHSIADFLTIALSADQESNMNMCSDEAPVGHENDVHLAEVRIQAGFDPSSAADHEANSGPTCDFSQLQPAPDDPIDFICSLSNQTHGSRPVTRSQTANARNDAVKGETKNKGGKCTSENGQDQTEKDSPEDNRPNRPGPQKCKPNQPPSYDRSARESALQASANPLHGFKLQDLNGNQRLNIVSLNLAGASMAKKDPADFCSDILALMARLQAQVMCIQDYNLVKDSWADKMICSLLGQVGLTMCRSIRKTQHSRFSSSRSQSMGVAIIAPSALTVKPSILSDETCMWIAVDIQIDPSNSARIFSISSPPGAKNSTLRKTINEATASHMEAADKYVIVASDSNDVVDPTIDTTSGNFNRVRNSLLKFLQNKMLLADSYRTINASKTPAFSRGESKMVQGHLHFSSSRIDHIHVSSNLVTKGMLIGAGIDNRQVIFTGTDHSPCVVSLDMSQHSFKKIEWHKGQPAKEPDWRLLNTAINEKVAHTAISAPPPLSVVRPIEAFCKEMQKHSEKFAALEGRILKQQAEVDRSHTANQECRETLNITVMEMLELTQKAGIGAGLDDFKRHSREDPTSSNSNQGNGTSTQENAEEAPNEAPAEVPAEKTQLDMVDMTETEVSPKETCSGDCDICVNPAQPPESTKSSTRTTKMLRDLNHRLKGPNEKSRCKSAPSSKRKSRKNITAASKLPKHFNSWKRKLNRTLAAIKAECRLITKVAVAAAPLSERFHSGIRVCPSVSECARKLLRVKCSQVNESIATAMKEQAETIKALTTEFIEREAAIEGRPDKVLQTLKAQIWPLQRIGVSLVEEELCSLPCPGQAVSATQFAKTLEERHKSRDRKNREGAQGRQTKEPTPRQEMSCNSECQCEQCLSQDEDDNQPICDNCNKGGDLICCDSCSRAWHQECLPEQLREGKDELECLNCSEFFQEIEEYRIDLGVNELDDDEKWSAWRSEFIIAYRKLSKRIERVQTQLDRASIGNSKQHRLHLLLRNETGKWHKLVAPKNRELPTPVTHRCGKALPTHEERMLETAAVHKDWAKKRGQPIPSLRSATDASGCPCFEWIYDDNEYEEALTKRLQEVREIEAVVNTERNLDRWEANEWKVANSKIEECRTTNEEDAAQAMHVLESDRIEKERQASKEPLTTEEGDRLCKAYLKAWT